MIEYRHAVEGDINRPDLRELVLKGLNASAIGREPNIEKLETLARQSLENGIWLVAEEDGKIVSHIVGLVTEDPLYDRRQLTVISWHSTSPGSGMRLLHLLMDWRKQFPMIASVVVCTNQDEKLKRILEKRGWIMHPQYLWMGD